VNNIDLINLDDILKKSKDDTINNNQLFTKFLTLSSLFDEVKHSSLSNHIGKSPAYFSRRYTGKISEGFDSYDKSKLYDFISGVLAIRVLVSKAISENLDPVELGFYRAFLEFYSVSQNSIRTLENEVLGSFVLWRWSTEVGGVPDSLVPSRAIVRGQIDFVFDRGTSCVKALMTQAARDVPEGDINELLKSVPSWENYSGFLFLRA